MAPSILQNLVQFTFSVAMFGMIAGCLFFALQKNEVDRRFRGSMILSSCILLVAAMNYFYMREVYAAGIASGNPKFPTEYRYIDWVLTVPLMLVKFPSLLGMGRRGLQFLTMLVTLALLMIVTGFAGELSLANKALHYGFFGIASVAWLLIVGLIYFALAELPPQTPASTRTTIRRMAAFILVGWAIYPVGYLLPSFGVAADWRELIYNVGDLVNKVGLAMVVFLGAKQFDRETEAVAPVAASAPPSVEVENPFVA